MIRQIQTLLEEGIKEKMTFAKVSIQGTIEKLQALQKDFSDPPFFSQFARNILYRKMALQIIEKKILPAFNVSLKRGCVIGHIQGDFGSSGEPIAQFRSKMGCRPNFSRRSIWAGHLAASSTKNVRF